MILVQSLMYIKLIVVRHRLLICNVNLRIDVRSRHLKPNPIKLSSNHKLNTKRKLKSVMVHI